MIAVTERAVAGMISAVFADEQSCRRDSTSVTYPSREYGQNGRELGRWRTGVMPM